MSDGTVFVGISPESGRALFVKPISDPLRLNWDQATKSAQGLNDNPSSYKDWRLPSMAELRVIRQNLVAVQDTMFPSAREKVPTGDSYNEKIARERWHKGENCPLLWTWSSELRDSPGLSPAVNWVVSKVNKYHDESARVLNLQTGQEANNLRSLTADVLFVRG